MSTPDPEEPIYLTGKCPKDHPLISKIECGICEKHKTGDLYEKMVSLYEEIMKDLKDLKLRKEDSK